MEIKQNTTPVIYVKMLDSTDQVTEKTGVTLPTVYFSKAGGVSTQLASPVWSEVDATNIKGVYGLTLTSAMTNIVGEIVISINAPGCMQWVGKYDVVANVEADTLAVVDAMRTEYTMPYIAGTAKNTEPETTTISDTIQFVEVDSKLIENELISGYEDLTGETLYPGDEKRIFLLNELPIIVGLKNNINETGKQNLLRYASGSILDAIGEFTNTVRIPPQKATTILKFTLSDAQINTVTIPSGTRVTPDGKLYFTPVTDLVIPSGETYGNIIAEAAETGEKYNNFTPGQIKTIVDPIPFVFSVTNINTTSGGADIESDDSYRVRIRLAPESFSTAGPEGAYEYWARTADSSIADVAITSPMEPFFNRTAFETAHPEIDLTPYFTEERPTGLIKVIPLMADGQLPTELVLDKVKTALSAKDKRPLTDYVQVEAPTEVQYDINLTYYISSERETEVGLIRAAIEGDGGAVDQYAYWQQAKLGREINPDELRRRCFEKGAFRIEINSPAFTAINENQVAKPNVKTVTYGGLI